MKTRKILLFDNKNFLNFVSSLTLGLVLCHLNMFTLACNSNSAVPSKPVSPRADNIDERFTYFESDILLPQTNPRAQRKNPVWPNSTLVYQFSTQFTEPQKEIILGAMREITEKTCIQFKENLQATSKTGDDYVYFRQGEEAPGCNSYVGRKGGLQMLNLEPSKECIQHGIVTHELVHALGLWHEDSRFDRDDYIDINWSNVKQNDKTKLAPYSYSASKARTFNTPYDYQSVMHRSAFAFAEDHGVATIVPKVNFVIGQRDGLSPGDIAKLKVMYNVTLIHCRNAALNTV